LTTDDLFGRGQGLRPLELLWAPVRARRSQRCNRLPEVEEVPLKVVDYRFGKEIANEEEV
jgi:hypothetical protein